jgi:hypothetical protein
VRGLDFNEEYMVTSSDDSNVTMFKWSDKSREPQQIGTAHHGADSHCALLLGSRAFTVGKNGELRCWDMESAAMLGALNPTGAQLWSVHARGDTMVVSDYAGNGVQVDPATMAEVARWTDPSGDTMWGARISTGGMFGFAGAWAARGVCCAVLC